MGKRKVANQSAERSLSLIVQCSFFVEASNICHSENNPVNIIKKSQKLIDCKRLQLKGTNSMECFTHVEDKAQ